MTLPQLHLRDLFWLMLAVALGMGWLSNYRSAQMQLQQQAEALRQTQLAQQDLAVRCETLEQQYRHLYSRHALSHRFHFDIVLSPQGKVDVRYVDDSGR